MGYCIAIFTSRHATLNFVDALRSLGVPAAIVNTPNSISKVCGISVKFPSEFLSVAKKASVGRANFSGFFAYNFEGRLLKL